MPRVQHVLCLRPPTGREFGEVLAPTGPVSKPSRPSEGAGHYLRDLVYGACDGVVTTRGLIAGSTGAGFPAAVGLILGLANLVADGLSMAVSNYLGLKSELEQTGASVDHEQPWRHGMATLVAFVVAGAVPLASYARRRAQPCVTAPATGSIVRSHSSQPTLAPRGPRRRRSPPTEAPHPASQSTLDPRRT